MARTKVAVGATIAVLVVTAGCVGFLTGSEPLSVDASNATVSDAALEETGYEERRVERATVNETFSAAGQSREVEVTNWVAEYRRSVDLGALGEQDAAAFVAFATPQVSVLGQTFNPVGDLSNRELVTQFTSGYEDVRNVRRVDSRNATMLGTETGVTEFAAATSMNGRDVDLAIHVARVEHDGDFVIALGVYPQRLDGEAERTFRLIEGVEHGG